jgi:hypothetical protein
MLVGPIMLLIVVPALMVVFLASEKPVPVEQPA